jgi:hypothetical protein
MRLRLGRNTPPALTEARLGRFNPSSAPVGISHLKPLSAVLKLGRALEGQCLWSLETGRGDRGTKLTITVLTVILWPGHGFELPDHPLSLHQNPSC